MHTFSCPFTALTMLAGRQYGIQDVKNCPNYPERLSFGGSNPTEPELQKSWLNKYIKYQ